MTCRLQLDQPGTLPRPGPVGRLVRLAYGAISAGYIWLALANRADLMSASRDGVVLLAIGIGYGFYIFAWIVNIGYGRDWGDRPRTLLLLALVTAAATSWLGWGTLWGPPLNAIVLVWFVYLNFHLGISYLLSAALATPGCEMRAIHHVYGKVRGQPVAEHCCPTGPLQPLDHWEARRRSRGK